MHRYLAQSLQEIETATAGLSDEQWNIAPPGKWTAALIVEHLLMTYTATNRGFQNAMANGPQCKAPSLGDSIKAFVVANLEYWPKGIQAPKHVEPKGVDHRQTLLKIKSTLEELDGTMNSCRQKFGAGTPVLTHPVLGGFSVDRWCRFHLSHTRHHMKQVEALKKWMKDKQSSGATA